MKNLQLQRCGVACLIFNVVLAGSADPDVTAVKKKELAELRQQASSYEKELQQHTRDETAQLNLLTSLDKEIDLTQALVRSLNGDLNRLEEQVGRRGQEIDGLSMERERLRRLIKDRMVYFYKYKRAKEIELLLSVQTWEQLSAWVKYVKLVTDNDRRNLQALQDRSRSLERQRQYMHSELLQKERGLQEKQREENRLQVSRKKRQTLLSNVQQNKKLVQVRLQEIKESEKQISNLIAKAEKSRIAQKQRSILRPETRRAEEPAVRASDHFADLKGRMVWPARGTVVSHFGREKHPELNTITENLGIEIRAGMGSPVITVADGEVQAITWQRGRGNIIIISHDDGFYTVYTHLQDIQVKEQQVVKRGERIGSVGDSGSLIGPVLHFQIWQNTTNLNPEEWLV